MDADAMQPTFCSACVRVHSRVVKMQLFETKGREMGRPNGRTGGSRVRALLCWLGWSALQPRPLPRPRPPLHPSHPRKGRCNFSHPISCSIAFGKCDGGKPGWYWEGGRYNMGWSVLRPARRTSQSAAHPYINYLFPSLIHRPSTNTLLLEHRS